MQRIEIHPRELASSRLSTLISFLVIAALCAISWVLLLENYQHALAYYRLEKTLGTITSIQLPNGLEYKFQIDGQEMIGHRAKLIPASKHRRVPRTETPEMAIEWAEENGIQVGQQVSIFYDSYNPKVHCLSTEHPEAGIIAFIYAPWIILVFSLGLIGWIFFERFKIERDQGSTPNKSMN